MGDGPFSPNRSSKLAESLDGLSNTMGLAEVKAYTNRIGGASNAATFAMAPEPPNSLSDIGLGVFNPASFAHVEWVDGKVHETGITTVFSPNTKVMYSNSDGTKFDVDIVLATESNPGDTYAAVTSRSYTRGSRQHRYVGRLSPRDQQQYSKRSLASLGYKIRRRNR